MKLEKAIEVGEAIWDTGPRIITPDELTAIQLLIEAGKRIGVGRRTGRFSWEDKLPGETEE